MQTSRRRQSTRLQLTAGKAEEAWFSQRAENRMLRIWSQGWRWGWKKGRETKRASKAGTSMEQIEEVLRQTSFDQAIIIAIVVARSRRRIAWSKEVWRSTSSSCSMEVPLLMLPSLLHASTARKVLDGKDTYRGFIAGANAVGENTSAKIPICMQQARKHQQRYRGTHFAKNLSLDSFITALASCRTIHPAAHPVHHMSHISAAKSQI